jgi:peptide deformylase
MILEINQATNPKERKFLETPALPIDDATKFGPLIEDLQDTAKNNEGKCVGMASNQVWREESPPPSIFIAKVGNPQKWKIFINSVIKGTGTKIKYAEGCMSFDGRKPKIKKRDKNVIIKYWSVLDRGEKTEKYFGFDARVIQHEYDHLLGKLI